MFDPIFTITKDCFFCGTPLPFWAWRHRVREDNGRIIGKVYKCDFCRGLEGIKLSKGTEVKCIRCSEIVILHGTAKGSDVLCWECNSAIEENSSAILPTIQEKTDECHEIMSDMLETFFPGDKFRLRYCSFDNAQQLYELANLIAEKKKAGIIPDNIEIVAIDGAHPAYKQEMIESTIYELKNILTSSGNPEKAIVYPEDLEKENEVKISSKPNRERSLVVLINDHDRRFFNQLVDMDLTFNFLAFSTDHPSAHDVICVCNS